MATAEQARNEVLGLLERLKADSEALGRALQALVTDERQPGAGPPEGKARFADQEAFLRMKSSLLAEYRGMFVAFANGQLVAAHSSLPELFQSLRTLDIRADVYVERVEEEAFLEPPEFECPGVHEIAEATEGLP